MSLIIRRRAKFELQIIRINWPGGKRDLVVVCVVERFRKRVTRPEHISMRQPLLDANKRSVIKRLYARFQIHHAIGSTDNRVEDNTNISTDNEVGTEIVYVISF